MKTLVISALALATAACAPIANTSQTVLTRSLLDRHTISGPGFPIVVSGAESVGLTPLTVAQNLRYPASLPPGSSFRAVADSPQLINHAHLAIGQNGASTLTFLHGERRIGVGTFTLPPQAYADPQALGSTSATLISSMLREAQTDRLDSDEMIWIRR